MDLKQLKRIFRTYQSLITAIAILLLAIIGFVVGIIPLSQKVFGLSQEVASTVADVAQLQHKVSVLDSIDETALRNDLVTLATAVPADKSLVTLLGTIDGVTAKTGVSLVDISLTKPGSLATDSAKKLTTKEAAVGSNVLSLVVSVSGSYDQIRTFLLKIGSVRRFLRVRSFDISVVAAEVTARVTLDTFYYPFPRAVGSLAQEVTALSPKQEETIKTVASMELASGQPVPETDVNISTNTSAGKTDPFSK